MKGEKYLEGRIQAINRMSPATLFKVMVRVAIILVLVAVCVFTCNALTGYYIDHPGYQEKQLKEDQYLRLRIAYDSKQLSERRFKQVDEDYDNLTWRQLRKIADSVDKTVR